MISIRDNDYAAVLDACVIVPWCLCDTLLRLAEEPAMYRPLWSERILDEAGGVLEGKLGLTPQQRKHRITEMKKAFPEALVRDNTPTRFAESLKGVADIDDRHVLAAAIIGGAQAIVTANTKDFPTRYLAQFDIACLHPDGFLVHQFHLDRDLVLEKLDAQAGAIGQQRKDTVAMLQRLTPKFARLVEVRL
jgi:hypothetical protein